MTTTGPLYCLGRCQYMKPTPFYSAHPLILTHYSISHVPAFLIPFLPFTVTAISLVYSTRTFFRWEFSCSRHFSLLQGKLHLIVHIQYVTFSIVEQQSIQCTSTSGLSMQCNCRQEGTQAACRDGMYKPSHLTRLHRRLTVSKFCDHVALTRCDPTLPDHLRCVPTLSNARCCPNVSWPDAFQQFARLKTLRPSLYDASRHFATRDFAPSPWHVTTRRFPTTRDASWHFFTRRCSYMS
jgi:hypothetical protein